MFLRNSIGKCLVCNSSLIPEKDAEGRKWARCPSCGARFPLESGITLINNIKEKARGNNE